MALLCPTRLESWTDEASGRTLPKFVTDELHGFTSCGILGRCFGRRMNEGALNLVDYVLPDVPLRQFVFTVPFPLRFLLAFDGALLGHVVRIFVDTVIGWYGRRHVERGLPPGESGAVAVIQRANSGQQAHSALSPELFIKTFGFEIVCQKCQSPLRLIALIKNGDIAKKILTAMHLPSEVPELHPARPPPQEAEGGGEDWVN